MKGKILFSILDFLKEGVGTFEDMVVAYLNAGHGASLSKLKYEQRKAEGKRLERAQRIAEDAELRRKCSRMIYYLKSQGFIVEEKGNFNITRKGKKKLEKLKLQKIKSLPTINYSKGKTPQLILISFDVPERERRKRAWLREVLRYLDFTMVHRSVWLGQHRIPKEFVQDLRNTGLIDFVEILSINRRGTLEKIV